MRSADYFSADYFSARDRFRELADALGLQQTSHQVAGDDLSIDVAIHAPKSANKTLIISSGLHGIEGFLGSAIQIRQMQNWKDQSLPRSLRVVLLHALNPHGFANRRRWNEDNVDLNRNFLLEQEEYTGCAETYHQLASLLNPQRPPARFNLFALQAAGVVLRYGMKNVKQAIAEGQYEYPNGLFFGGHKPGKTTTIVTKNMPDWVADSSQVVHIDVHSGLGKSGTYKLLIDYPLSQEHRELLEEHFGPENVETGQDAEEAYTAQGGWGRWCVNENPNIQYTYLCAEFGTYGPIQVLNRLRTENQAHQHCDPSDPRLAKAKDNLQEAFCPNSEAWRKTTLEHGDSIVAQSIQCLCNSN